MANEYSADIPKGFNVPKQVRLDSITGIQNETTLKNLGTGNNLAFKYYDGLKVRCKDEKTEYIWREVVGLETGLLDTAFTYPNYLPVDGIDYSGKTYNFFEAPTSNVTLSDGSETKINSGTNTTVTGLGTISSPYVINSIDTVANGSETKINEGDNITIIGNGTTLTPYVINADLTDLGLVKTVNNEIIAPGQSLSIINSETTGKVLTTKEYVQSVIPSTPNGSETKIESGENIIITGTGTTLDPYIINSYTEIPIIFDIPSLIVNSDYTGLEETGTESKPFKNLQNALDAYVGEGVNNKVPDLLGAEIVIKKDVNTFIGSLTYAGLKLSIESTATLTSNPSVGEFLLDVDSEATLPTNINYSMLPFNNTETCDIVITIKSGGSIQLQKEGIKNRGNTRNTGALQGKIIRIFGNISGIYKIAEASVVSPSIQRILSLNADNQTGFFNDGAEANIIVNGSSLQSFNSQLIYVGLNMKLLLKNTTLQFGSGSTPFNINTVPIQINGGNVITNNVEINNPLNLVNLISLKTQTTTGAVFNSVNSKIGDSCNYIFSNLDTGSITANQLILDKCSNYSNQIEALIKNFMSSNIWNVKFTNCNFIFWEVDENKIALIPGNINILDSKVVETLPIYSSRAAAIIGGLFTGCKFINTAGVISPTTGWTIDIVI